MKELNRKTAGIKNAFPERILQFGGGNFLRAFVDWIIDVYNEKTNSQLGVLLVTPIERDNYSVWQKQEGLYHVLTKGIRQGNIHEEKHLVNCISRILHLYPGWHDYLKSAENPEMRIIISNTTEAGIRFSPIDKITDSPPNEFPAKLCRWLHHRFQHFKGATESGCIFFPVELIDKNGTNLKECIIRFSRQWGFEEEFIEWLHDANYFCNTLVDRIVPGISPDKIPDEWQKLGFKDQMLTQGEVFHFWAIEAPEQVRKELPLDKIGLNIVFTDDLTPYRSRKVRILNGAHTAMVPVAYLSGFDEVRESIEDQVVGNYVQKLIFKEVIPTLDLPEEELIQFANEVLDRFRNPFIRHALMSISLNSISKFKTRVLPSILEYHNRTGKLPSGLVFSFAALLLFYSGNRKGQAISLNDDQWILDYLKNLWLDFNGSEQSLKLLVKHFLSWNEAWETELTLIPGLEESFCDCLLEIMQIGIYDALKSVYS